MSSGEINREPVIPDMVAQLVTFTAIQVLQVS